MRVELDTELKNFDGLVITDTVPIKDKWVQLPDGTQTPALEVNEDGTPKVVPVTLRRVLRDALLYKRHNDDMPLQEQMQRISLVKQISRKKWLDLTAEEVALCKTLVSKIFTMTILSAVVDVIDPAATAEE